jgi:hypothetical protein
MTYIIDIERPYTCLALDFSKKGLLHTFVDDPNDLVGNVLIEFDEEIAEICLQEDLKHFNEQREELPIMEFCPLDRVNIDNPTEKVGRLGSYSCEKATRSKT